MESQDNNGLALGAIPFSMHPSHPRSVGSLAWARRIVSSSAHFKPFKSMVKPSSGMRRLDTTEEHEEG